MRNFSNRISYKHTLIILAVVAIAYLATLFIYVHGPLDGQFNKFFLPAKMFGVPSDLRAKGIDELFKDDLNTGWDGQFYYYIANDPLALKDTAQHVDADAYRYQRVGLPLLAKVVSVLSFQSWVSPLTYYLTSLFIILLAVFFAANFFQQRKFNPYLILFWALGMGTMVTQLNGLPDAAADGLLIIALICLIRGWSALYAIAISFAGLSREIYLLLPLFFILVEGVLQLKRIGLIKSISIGPIMTLFKKTWMHIIPVIVIVGWQCYVRIRFHVSPSDQAHGILGLPLAATFKYMLGGYKRVHPLLGDSNAAYMEGFGITFYLLLVIAVLRELAHYLAKFSKEKEFNFISIGLAFVAIIAMYLCFGRTVMMHHTGYFKAANIFLFLLPFMACLEQTKLSKISLCILFINLIFFDYLLWNRISTGPYHTERIVYAQSQPACLKNYSAQIKPLSLEMVYRYHFLKHVFGPSTTVITAEIKNTSNEIFYPYQGKGGVNLSYQWLDAKTLCVIKDGYRSSLLEALPPHKSTVLPLRLSYPHKPGQYILKVTLVQEGCSWFYLANPNSAFSMPYTVR
ncbi:MAG TPA: hypothetical protein VHA13_03925 [Gammaproteobacteria bacterium]|nr:hypothetical protein [Gammaproteobacteria bacterium]